MSEPYIIEALTRSCETYRAEIAALNDKLTAESRRADANQREVARLRTALDKIASLRVEPALSTLVARRMVDIATAALAPAPKGGEG